MEGETTQEVEVDMGVATILQADMVVAITLQAEGNMATRVNRETGLMGVAVDTEVDSIATTEEGMEVANTTVVSKEATQATATTRPITEGRGVNQIFFQCLRYVLLSMGDRIYATMIPSDR